MHRRGAERAQALADEVGGEALRSNADGGPARRRLVLCHKPPQLEAVAAGVGGRAKAIASILGGTTLRGPEGGLPRHPRVPLPAQRAVEVRTGALGYAEQELDEAAAALEPQVLELFGRLGRWSAAASR